MESHAKHGDSIFWEGTDGTLYVNLYIPAEARWAARALDVMQLGEMQPERDHQLTSELSNALVYRGRRGRDVRSGGFLEFTLRCRAGLLALQATYWGAERARDFDLLVDGQRVATQHLGNDRPGEFFAVDYPLDAALTAGKSTLRVRVEPHDRSSAGPVFGMRVYARRADAQQ